MSRAAWICDGVRTPFGRLQGGLAGWRTDDLAALPLAALLQRNPTIDPAAIDEVVLGCANQAGEDNRNVARMAALLAGLPASVPGVTVNRLCASSLEAVAYAARMISLGEADLVLAGGVESMSRAPWVTGKTADEQGQAPAPQDTTLGWRFINPRLQAAWGTDSMAQTAENLARELNISRPDQDAYALRSQQRAARALEWRSGELLALPGSGQPGADEQPRPDSSLDKLATLKPILGPGTSITAGNASGLNDGAAAVLLASDAAVRRFSLQPGARVVGMTAAGVAPRIMGLGPVPATRKLLARLQLRLDQCEVIELNEAFAAQVLAVTRELGLADDEERVNPNGGAIALGHPLGASGARLVITAGRELARRQGRHALLAMCVGVGQGVAMVIERAD